MKRRPFFIIFLRPSDITHTFRHLVHHPLFSQHAGKDRHEQLRSQRNQELNFAKQTLDTEISR